MDRIDDARQVWIFLKESDQWQHRPLFVAVVELLRREGIAGATVLRGLAGYGAHSHIHIATLVELSDDLPIVVTFVDRADAVERVLPRLAEIVQVGLISVTPAQIVITRQRAAGPFPAHLAVADVMSLDVAQVRPDTPMDEIVTLLIDRALRALPVVDERGRVVGIITDGDLLARGALELSVDLQQALPLAERAAHVASLAGRPHRAADLMTRDPVTLGARTPLAQAAAAMADRDLKRLPVVDGQGRLVGMVSRSDLLATVAEGQRQRPAEPLPLPAGAPVTVGEIMLRDVPTVHRDTPLSTTIERLLDTAKRRVVVVDDSGQVVGIITDGDVLRRAAQRDRPGALRSLLDWFAGERRPDGVELATVGRAAADVMTSPVVTVAPDRPIASAIGLMIAHRIKRLPVVAADGRLVGMVGRAGALAALGHRGERGAEQQ
jgi:CBS domain-containing protein